MLKEKKHQQNNQINTQHLRNVYTERFMQCVVVHCTNNMCNNDKMVYLLDFSCQNKKLKQAFYAT